MATIEEVRNELNKAEVRLGEATKNLKTFEEGKCKGEKLNDLGEKLFNEEWKDEKEKGRWEGAVSKLEEEKKSLEEKERFWRGQMEEWGKKLREFGGGEGNEQIA
jgi:hypothetical protein